MLISAVVCTRNRAASLQRTLSSLENQTLASEDYEIVVVDNGSTDETPDLLRRRGHGPVKLRNYHVAKPGLSLARNLGATEAVGPLVAFIDDDAEADPTWLEALCTAFDQHQQRPLSVGGKILPVWQGAPPEWLPPLWLAWLTILDCGPDTRKLDFPREMPFGCNIAFEKSFLLKSGGFDPRLGRRGKNLASGEEFRMLEILQNDGGEIFYTPSAVVRHFISRERLSFDWFMRRSFGVGASTVILERLRPPPGGHVAMPRRLLEHAHRLRLAGNPRIQQVAFICLTAIAYEAGRAAQSLSRS